MVDSNLKLDSSTLQYFCHLLESSLARINWIRAVDKFCVEQLISCPKVLSKWLSSNRILSSSPPLPAGINQWRASWIFINSYSKSKIKRLFILTLISAMKRILSSEAKQLFINFSMHNWKELFSFIWKPQR